MIFPVKRVKEELINEFAVSKMDINTFCEMHNIKVEAFRSWVDEKIKRSKLEKEKQEEEGEKKEVFRASDFVEIDIPEANRHSISIGENRKELITVRAGGIEIDIPIETEETILFKILQTAASI